MTPVMLVAILGSTIFLAHGQQASALVNSPPIVNQIPDQVVEELQTLTFNASASDPDGQQISFSLQNAPYGASIDSATGVFTWTPTEEQGSGIYKIDVVVTDGFVISAGTVTIIVKDVGGGGDSGGGHRSFGPSDLGSSGESQQGPTELTAEPANIPLDGVTGLKQESDPVNDGKLVSLTVQEPDGDVCAADGGNAEIPVEGLAKEYPTDFALVTDAGDGTCDTGDVGTYYAESEVSTKSGTLHDNTQFETDSPFVLPESPVGLVALLGSSLAALGAFALIRSKTLKI